jgi:DNA-binding transcriptional LysR family regulator
MDIRVLKYFVAVAKEKNITRAAESLHIAQPSLSKQLIELENELGKQLLIRGKRKIDLTDGGVLLFKRAEEIITLFDKTQQELSRDSETIGGKISIGGMMTAEIISAASNLHSKYSDVIFDFYSGDATDVTERLDHGSLDFAVLLKPVDTMKYEYLSLRNNSCWGLLMPKNCKSADKEFVTKEDLCSLPLIFHSRVGLQREITHWAETSIEKMNIVATYNILSGNPLDFVKNGLGCLLTSSDHLPSKLDNELCFKELYPKLELSYALVWKRNATLSNQSKAFLNEIRK